MEALAVYLDLQEAESFLVVKLLAVVRAYLE
jgi:hypothetical protein